MSDVAVQREAGSPGGAASSPSTSAWAVTVIPRA